MRQQCLISHMHNVRKFYRYFNPKLVTYWRNMKPILMSGAMHGNYKFYSGTIEGILAPSHLPPPSRKSQSDLPPTFPQYHEEQEPAVGERPERQAQESSRQTNRQMRRKTKRDVQQGHGQHTLISTSIISLSVCLLVWGRSPQYWMQHFCQDFNTF